jgi:hypothetical protein
MIPCLGWGSLCWDARDLPLAGAWATDGPLLPVEFARVSADQRITLVLTDASDGVQVLWAPLDVRTMEEAVSALGHREGIDAPFTAIGRYPARGKASPHLGIIGAWAESKGLAGVVWTALKPGLDRENRGSVPSLDQLRTHATGLTTEERMRALEYVQRAPAQIETPYRSALLATLRPA